MHKFIKKLIERLEEKEKHCHDMALAEIMNNGHSMDAEHLLSQEDTYENIIEIVNELAEEFNVSEMPTGWIPCSERLPEDDSMCLVTVEYSSGRIEVNYGWFDRVAVCWYVGMHEFRTSNVHAWMPLPAPYTEGE